MLNDEEFIRSRLLGQPTIYEAEKHIGLMHKVFSAGKDVSRYCKEADIGRTTFYNWLKKHKEFRDSYEILINYAEAHWQDKSEDPGMNQSIWLHVMKTRFNPFKNYSKQACLKELSRCETFGQMQRIIIAKTTSGELTTEEGKNWMDLIGRALKTEDIAILIDRTIALEKKIKEKHHEV